MNDRPAIAPNPTELGRRIDVLAARLAEQGDLTDDRWRVGMRLAPRSDFVPARAMVAPSGGLLYPIDRNARLEEWFAAAYDPYASIAVQADDGHSEVSDPGSVWTSSLSQPAVVVPMLQHLGVGEHDRVLDVGTGTGWTSALLYWTVGERGKVVTVEIDGELASAARDRFTRMNLPIEVVTADAATCDLGEATFERVHVGVGVNKIPIAWIRRVRIGGTLVLPYMAPFGARGAQLQLQVIASGHAIGRFRGPASFMMIRDQRPAPDQARDIVHPITAADVTWSRVDPRCVVRPETAGPNYGGDIFISELVPDVAATLHPNVDDPGESTLWLRETTSDAESWATAAYMPGCDSWEVIQQGPRRLWDEVEDAWLTWKTMDSPGLDRLGVVVHQGGQYLWCDSPGQQIRKFH